MNKKIFLLMLWLLGIGAIANAQDDGKITIRGTVVDSKTGEPVAFANLGLLGTVAGVASDMDGHFELTVPDKYATHTLRISAVGYANQQMKLYEAQDKDPLKIELTPVTYGIGEVDVYGQLLVYKKMLQNVVNRIGKNYISDPYSYEGYFKYRIERDGAEQLKEATVTVFDAKGYVREDVASAFTHVNYRYNQARRNRPAQSVLDGLTHLDDILTADIVRNTRNVLDISNSRDYKLKSKGKTVYEGDSVQIIAYEVPQPSLSTTGDASVSRYTGEIYINLKDHAVLKNVTYIDSKDFTTLGRNLIPVGETPKTNVKMTMTTTYKKLKSVYFLSGVKIQYDYREEGNPVKGEMEYVTTRVNTKNPVLLEGRTYYEDLRENEDFWNRYSVYFEEE